MPAVHHSVDQMLSGATDFRPLTDGPGKSGASLQRLTIDRSGYVVKFLDPAVDWTMRASGVLAGPVVALWERGILDELPQCLVQPIVAVAVEVRPAPERPLTAVRCWMSAIT